MPNGVIRECFGSRCGIFIAVSKLDLLNVLVEGLRLQRIGIWKEIYSF